MKDSHGSVCLYRGSDDCVCKQLIIDSFGSAAISDRFFDELTDAGGRYHCFSTRKGLGYIIRNHQKILIAKTRAESDEQMVNIQILLDLCIHQDNNAIVTQMKYIVPEFISNNSEYQKLDK